MIRLFPLLTLFLFGCSAPTITSNCDNTADFSTYKTFTFAYYEAYNKPNHPEYENLENRALIEYAIANELQHIGYSQVAEKGDLTVVYDIIIKDMVDPRVDSAVIYKPWVDTKIDSFNYTEGLLVIRLIDRQIGKMVWQGSLSGILNRKPQRFGNKVEQYITKLFSTLSKQMQ